MADWQTISSLATAGGTLVLGDDPVQKVLWSDRHAVPFAGSRNLDRPDPR